MKVVIDTNITAGELYEFTLNHNYKSFHGIISWLFSVASAIGAVIYWDRLTDMNKLLIVLFALMFTVFEPVGCYIKVKKQIKKNFKDTLSYTFDDSGITIQQNDAKAECTWNDIMKVTSTKHLINVYTSPARAFILPKKDVGGDFENLKKIIEEKAQCYKIVIR